MRTLPTLLLLGSGLVALAVAVPATAVPAHAGKRTGEARSHVNKPQAYSGGNQQRSANNRVNSGQRTNANRRGNNVVAGNTVVVGGQPGRGYYNNGNYYGSPHWDDDDNDVLEFVGKTAAVTAGASIVAAVIGDVTKDKPSDCEPVNVGGQQYLNCNGVAYQQVQGGYQVVAPPTN